MTRLQDVAVLPERGGVVVECGEAMFACRELEFALTDPRPNLPPYAPRCVQWIQTLRFGILRFKRECNGSCHPVSRDY